VPPYISPYPRYIAGAVWNADRSAQIFYLTIDQLRNDESLLDTLSKSDIIAVIALSNPLKILCGPAARYGFGMSGGKKTRETNFVEAVFDLIVKGDGEIVLYELLKNKSDLDKINSYKTREHASDIRKFALTGSSIVCQHPFYPDYLISEIETYRGCSRSIVGGCSFCSEPSKGSPDFRPIKDILDEIQELYKHGIRHFRIGNQPCIFSYMAKNAGDEEFPRPNPQALEQLFKGIRNVAPDLKTLHIDNANPGILSRYPSECKRIAKTIVKYHTSGDVAAFGVESVDPVVIKKNNLKATAEEVYSAIKLLNDVGSKTKTFDLNYEFLKNILDDDLLIRRINLRQIIPIKDTNMHKIGNKIVIRNKNEFQRFKRQIKENIERPLLKKILPNGTVLKDVFTEAYRGKLTYSRQIGSYPLLIGIPGILQLHTKLDVKVIDYGYRSITAVPFPLDINIAQRETIEALPHIGKKRAIRIMAKRPFKDRKHFIDSLDDPDVGNKILSYLSFR